MSTTLQSAVRNYLRTRNSAPGTQAEYRTTLAKWKSWGGGVPIERLGRKEIREFLDWVYDRAVCDDGINPGRTSNKAREHLRAVISWAWEQDLIDSLPRFPKPRPQRDVAGRRYLTKAEINALYFATHKMKRPRGWNCTFSVGRYWRAALVLFFNYGVDTGTIWRSSPEHEPILWRHVSWDRQSPDGRAKEQSPWGWLYYRRVKTRKAFYRPMNRVVHAHLRSISTENRQSDDPVFLGGGSRPNSRFQELCNLAGIKPRKNIETGEDIKAKLLKGDQAGKKTFKVHLDGFNQTDYLSGRSKESARPGFFYFSDDGDLLAVRGKRIKAHFMIQEATGIDVWRHPFTILRAPIFFDLKIDPGERAQEGMNYNDWWYRRAYVLVPIQEQVAKVMETFKEFPPRQKPASFTVGDALEALSSPIAPGK